MCNGVIAIQSSSGLNDMYPSEFNLQIYLQLYDKASHAAEYSDSLGEFPTLIIHSKNVMRKHIHVALFYI
jgi:hypothetical protein